MVYLGSVGKDSETEPRLATLSEAFHEALRTSREKEIFQGMSSTGPHRDDLRFLVNGVDIGIYGSRGQQRTIALSLRLAEGNFMLGKKGESPILLLDDVLSELDAERRHHLLEAVTSYQQVLITTTDLDRFEPAFLAQATRFKVIEGTIQPL